MIFSAAILQQQLSHLEDVAGAPQRLVVAFSGGLDSMVLLHGLSELRRCGAEIRAIHINHGLREESAAWAVQCQSRAAAVGIDCQVLQVAVARDSGMGLEAAAREARYTALRSKLLKGDWLLTAHHRDDQAETVLQQLIRGGGPAGIAGIGAIRRFGRGWLARPILNIDRAAMSLYATEKGLQWIEDPTNADRHFDRNFLRHEVLPVLKSRWPDVAVRLQRSARHASEASQLMNDLAALDFGNLAARVDRLPIDGLSTLSAARQRNLIRWALRKSGLATPTSAQLQRVLDEVIPAREDAQPLVTWPGASVRRYRNGLYLLPENLNRAINSAQLIDGQINLGGQLGSLRLVYGAREGVAQDLVGRGLRVEMRVGGEEIRPIGQSHTRKLKKLLQEEGVVPWMRDQLPLVYAGEQLVAVGDLWLAADAASRPGVALEWHGRPALH